MKTGTMLITVAALSVASAGAFAGDTPETTGISVAGGYSQVKIRDTTGSVTPAGTDFLARLTYSVPQGGFVKAEYERSDTGHTEHGIHLDALIEETRIGLGWSVPIAPGIQVYPAADYVINHQDLKLSGSGGSIAGSGTDHGYFVGGGGSIDTGNMSIYGRAGYYHVKGYGVTTTGPDALAGVGFNLSPVATLFFETRYTPLSSSDTDYDFFAVRIGMKLKIPNL